MKLDWKKLKTTIVDETRRIREIKAKMHEPFQPRFTWQDRRDLANLKWLATLHHAIAAHARRHIHITHGDLSQWMEPPKDRPMGPMSLEEQAKFIEAELPAYTVKELPPEVSQQSA